MHKDLLIIAAVVIIGFIIGLGLTTKSPSISTCEHGHPYYSYCPYEKSYTKQTKFASLF